MALGLFYAGSIIGAGPTTAGLAGRHQVGVLHCHRGSTAGYRLKTPRRSRPGRSRGGSRWNWVRGAWWGLQRGDECAIPVAKRGAMNCIRNWHRRSRHFLHLRSIKHIFCIASRLLCSCLIKRLLAWNLMPRQVSPKKASVVCRR